MFAGIFSFTPSFSPEINKVYLILSNLIHVATRYRLLVLHFQYTFVLMKENIELKSHHALSLIRMLQGQHVLVSSQN